MFYKTYGVMKDLPKKQQEKMDCLTHDGRQWMVAHGLGWALCGQLRAMAAQYESGTTERAALLGAAVQVGETMKLLSG